MVRDTRSGGDPNSTSAQGPAPNRICCCNLRTAGVVVAFVEFLLCVLAVYGLIRNQHIFGFPYLFWFIVGLLSILVILFAIALLLYAIKKENSRLLIPHLSAQIFFILFMLIVVLVVALLLIFGAYKGIRRLLGHGDYYMSDDSTLALGYLIIVVYLSLAILEMFFLYIIYKLYLYLKEYKRLTNSPTGGESFYGGGSSNNPYSSNEWYIAPRNDHASGGSPEAGDIYPYDAPLSP